MKGYPKSEGIDFSQAGSKSVMADTEPVATEADENRIQNGHLVISQKLSKYSFPDPYTHQSLDYYRNIVGDVAVDNVLRDTHPEVKQQGFNQRLLNRFLPEKFLLALREALRGVPEGNYFYTQPVGKKEYRTSHPHCFIIESHAEETQLYLLDPENFVAERKWYRPDITNLAAIRIPKAPDVPPSLAIFRQHNKSIPLEHLQIRPQYEAAKGLFGHDCMTEEMQQFPDQVLYRLLITPDKRLIQSTYGNREQATDYLNGEPANKLLEAREAAYRHLISQFLRFLYEGKFKVAERLFAREDAE
jgi:hypothetical protein